MVLAMMSHMLMEVAARLPLAASELQFGFPSHFYFFISFFQINQILKSSIILYFFRNNKFLIIITVKKVKLKILISSGRGIYSRCGIQTPSLQTVLKHE